ncbi:nucleotidyl transferase AbiEii/AbiGii toxin family protein [Sphingomonas sanguinis]|uniref:Nucleotidyl transferase AbiEii/AbiGii toxin family protein n=1 Tax=Sphingomonas sanguinis TaxID=33051 RepID=A0A147IYJ2_9SPHN|nr:nucleotidyl transferase AbiEii/AbiGii toxin family protein [Sphingomonas sanguinis]KTW00852.1 hypothetical protein SB4_06700 [Sphingomonas sanguinis]
MARDVLNIGASVRARLLDRARREGADFQNILTRYALERLLYRLSVSAAGDRFVLKGAMLFAAWVDDPFRPTGDLDLLGFGEDEAEQIATTFRDICSLDVSDDGVAFDVEGLTAANIRETADYGGVRVRTSATIGGARVPVQIDIGFGDAVTPDPVEIDYPILLDGPPPHLRAYPAQTVVAEKFEALVSLGLANSRMKDFYDLWMISRTFGFTSVELREATTRTFTRRRSDLPVDVPSGLSDDFVAAKRGQWRAFLARERLSAAPEDFATVVQTLRDFLLTPLAEAEPSTYAWPPGGPWSVPAPVSIEDQHAATRRVPS